MYTKGPAGLPLVVGLLALLGGLAQPAPGRLVSERFRALTRATEWRETSARALGFDTYHPQGLVKIGETFYLSSVEVTSPPRLYAEPIGGVDRDAGEGRGHLFKFDAEGHLLADLRLGEGAIYHPGGIDYDGQFIWVPVAEYRPHSRSIVYRVDPQTLRATEVLRYPDHLGGIVRDVEGHGLHALSWGSRVFYRWPLDERGQVAGGADSQRNGAFYIDYQDCKSLGQGEALCAGLSSYRLSDAAPRLALGGLELVEVSRGRAVHQLPIELRTPSGRPMTQNPFWVEPTERGLRFYFVPEDRQSTLYIYEVTTSPVAAARPVGPG